MKVNEWTIRRADGWMTDGKERGRGGGMDR